MTVLTFDNLLLPRPKLVDKTDARPSAVVCTEGATEAIADFVRESLAPNTRAAYLSDLDHFEGWEGGYRPSPRPSPRTLPRTPTP